VILLFILNVLNAFELKDLQISDDKNKATKFDGSEILDWMKLIINGKVEKNDKDIFFVYALNKKSLTKEENKRIKLKTINSEIKEEIDLDLSNTKKLINKIYFSIIEENGKIKEIKEIKIKKPVKIEVEGGNVKKVLKSEGVDIKVKIINIKENNSIKNYPVRFKIKAEEKIIGKENEIEQSTDEKGEVKLKLSLEKIKRRSGLINISVSIYEEKEKIADENINVFYSSAMDILEKTNIYNKTEEGEKEE